MRQLIFGERYEVMRKIGSGAMGDVYQVRDRKSGRIIALKILSSRITTTETLQRFKREFQLLVTLRHPNLCQVYDFGTLKDGRSYFTMEYVQGKNIFDAAKELCHEETYPVRKNISNAIFPWIVQLCRALEYIHAKGYIHFDVKPGNILIETAQGRSGASEKKYPIPRNTDTSILNAKLLDFGLAGEHRIRGAGIIKGTFPYIAPEVIKGLAIDHRADLYSLGVLLYEIFTRKSLRIKGKTSIVTLLKQSKALLAEPPSKIVPNIPKALEKIIMRLIASEPSDRFSRANEVIKEINSHFDTKFELETEKTIEGHLLSSRFVGREKEMALLQALYAQAQQGHGKVVLISGEAGIGKSRLLREFKVSIQLAHGHCLTGFSYQDRITPLGPFYDIVCELINHAKDQGKLRLQLAVLSKIFPDLIRSNIPQHLPKLAPLEPQQERLRIMDALLQVVKHVARTLGELVLLLEDLHWADDFSLQFLKYLGRNIGETNILICGTVRKDELAGNQALRQLMINLKADNNFHQFELVALAAKDFQAFLDSMITTTANSSELTRYLMHKTGGNPFFVEEIMRMFFKSRCRGFGEHIDTKELEKLHAPIALEDVALSRIKDLSKEALDVVAFGAILLEGFSYDLMKSITNIDDIKLSNVLWELKRKDVLKEEDNKYRFYHSTLAEAVYRTMNTNQRQNFHNRIARVLETVNRENIKDVIDDVAYHFIKAFDHAKGVRYGLEAARLNAERYAYEQSIKFYKDVLEIFPRKNSKQYFDILWETATVEHMAGYYAQAISDYQNLLENDFATKERQARILINIGKIQAIKGHMRKSLDSFQKALVSSRQMKPRTVRSLFEAFIKLFMFSVYHVIGDHKRAVQIRLPPLESFEDLKGRENRKILSIVQVHMGLFELYKAEHGKGDREKAIVYLKQAYKYRRTIDSRGQIASALANLGRACESRADYQKALEYYYKALKTAESTDPYTKSSLLLSLSEVLMLTGRYAETLSKIEEALTASRNLGSPVLMANGFLQLGIYYLESGNYQAARENLLDALDSFQQIGWHEKRVYAIRAVGNLYQALGNYTSALVSYREAMRYCRKTNARRVLAFLLIDISLLFIEIGVVYKIEPRITEALEITNMDRLEDVKAVCLLCLCRFNLIKRDYTTAKKYCEKGLHVADHLGLKPLSLRFHLLLSEICYHEKKYMKGIQIASRAMEMTNAMAVKEPYAETLLLKAHHSAKQGALSNISVIKLLDEARRIAEEIGNPELQRKVYFEYGRFLQENKDYVNALRFYKECLKVMKHVSSRLKNISYQKSYLNRPDRQEVFTAIKTIKNLV